MNNFDSWFRFFWGDSNPKEDADLFTIKDLKNAYNAGMNEVIFRPPVNPVQLVVCAHEYREESSAGFFGSRCWKCQHVAWINGTR